MTEKSAIAPYSIEALNDAEASENRLHSDDIAQKYGFGSALVSGASVFGYMTHPLVATYGENWLSNTIAQVSFQKPAYQNDLLSISSSDMPMSEHARHHITSAYNKHQVLLASLESWQPLQLPAIDSLAYAKPDTSQPIRKEIQFDIINLKQTATAHTWIPDSAQNNASLSWQREALDLYHCGDKPLLHPYTLLNECNQALKRMFILPAWIHVGSRMIFRKAIRLGHTVDVRITPIEKWQRKGHEFVKLYIVMRADGEIALEVEHTAIFSIAERN